MLKRLAVFTLLAGAATTAFAQGSVSFVAILPNSASINVANGSVIPLSATGTGGTTVAFIATYSGPANTTATLNQFSVSGSTDYQLVSAGGSTTLTPGQSFTFGVRYVPGSSSPTAVVSLVVGVNGTSIPTSFTLASTVADFSYSVISPQDGSSATLQPGSRVQFAPTPLGTSSQRVILVSNRGTAAGTIDTVALSGAEFSFFSSAPAGVTLQPGQSARIDLAYRPTQRGVSLGTLTIRQGDRNIEFPLVGTSTAPELVASYSFSTNGNNISFGDGAVLTFPETGINTTSQATVTIVNRGDGAGTVDRVEVSGADFLLLNSPLLPATLNQGQAVSFAVRYAPRSATGGTGTLRIVLGDRTISVTLSGRTAPPDFIVSYVDETNSLVPANEGATVTLPNIPFTASLIFTVVVGNRGSGPGQINGVSISGTDFQVTALPLLPLQLDPNRELRFNVRFSPQSRGVYRGILSVRLDDRIYMTRFEITATGPVLAYEFAAGGDIQPVEAGSTITAPSTQVGASSTIQVLIHNRGDADADLSLIALAAPGFELTDAPFLPARLIPGASQRLVIRFTPNVPGPFQGRLRIGADQFNITGTGLGARLVLAYLQGSGLTTATPNSSILYTPQQIGETVRLPFVLTNTGTADATVAVISVSSATGAYRVADLRPLPVVLAPEGSVTFNLLFTPNRPGAHPGVLNVNGTGYPVSGLANDPPPMPSYEFTGASGRVQAQQQLRVGLRLHTTYPLPLIGFLTLNVDSRGFGVDPAVQFATGGRVVQFSIPANTQEAVFAGGDRTIGLQTGTVTGVITLTPAFALQGGFEITPETPPTHTLTVPEGPPVVLGIQLQTVSATSFSVRVIGYSTTRSLRQLRFQLNGVAGSPLANSSVTVDTDTAALLWYRSEAGQSTGGLFGISVPFNLQGGKPGDTTPLTNSVQSVTVTAVNSLGDSSPVSLTLR